MASLLAVAPLERMTVSVWFLTIAVGCFLLLLLSLVFGHDHDHDHDVDHDHDSGASGHMSVFSIKILLAFGVGFGSAGYIGARSDLSWMGSTVCGFAGGLVIGGITYLFLNALFTHQASSTVSHERPRGCDGHRRYDHRRRQRGPNRYFADPQDEKHSSPSPRQGRPLLSTRP